MTDENFPLLAVNQPDYQSVRPDMLVLADVEHGGYIGANKPFRGVQKCEYPASVWRVLGTTMIVTLAGFAAVTMMQWTQTGSTSIREVESDAVTGESLMEVHSGQRVAQSDVMKTIFSFVVLDPKEALKMQLLNKHMYEEVVPEILQTIDPIPWWSLEEVEMKSVGGDQWRFVCSEAEKGEGRGEFFLRWSNKSKEEQFKWLPQKPEKYNLKKGYRGLFLRPLAGKEGPEDLKLTFSGQCPYPVVIAVEDMGANSWVRLSDDDWGAQNFVVDAARVRSVDLTRAANFQVRARKIGVEGDSSWEGYINISKNKAVTILGPKSVGIQGREKKLDYVLPGPETKKEIHVTVDSTTSIPSLDHSSRFLKVSCKRDERDRKVFQFKVDEKSLKIAGIREELWWKSPLDGDWRLPRVLETRPRRDASTEFLAHADTKVFVKRGSNLPDGQMAIFFQDGCASSQEPDTQGSPTVTVDMEGLKSGIPVSLVQANWSQSLDQFWTKFTYEHEHSFMSTAECKAGYYKIADNGENEYVLLEKPLTNQKEYATAYRTRKNSVGGDWEPRDKANDYWCEGTDVLMKGGHRWKDKKDHKKYTPWDHCANSESKKVVSRLRDSQAPDAEDVPMDRPDNTQFRPDLHLVVNVQELAGVFYPDGKLRVISAQNAGAASRPLNIGILDDDSRFSKIEFNGSEYYGDLLRRWKRCSV